MWKWWNRLSIFVILLVAAGAIYAVWPNEPDRYLPDAIPWPHGKGVPSTILGLELPCHSSAASANATTSTDGTTTTTKRNPAADCRGMTLGLDLQGGSRVVLQAEVPPDSKLSAADIADGIDANKSIIESRINPLGVSESQVQTSGGDRLIVEAPGISGQQLKDLTRPAVLMFCEGMQQGGQGGAGSPLAVVPDGSKVYYKPGTCQPDVDANGAVALKDANGDIAKNPDGTVQRVTPQYASTAALTTDSIVWVPAKGDLDGVPTIMTGQYLKRDTQVQFDQLSQPILTFSMTSQGQKIFGSLSQRIGDPTNGLPLATFLDGEPIRGKDGRVIAPRVQGQITDTGQTTGLTLNDAKRLKTFLNNGAFPIQMKVIQQQDVDATLGDQAVLHSVQAGLVAMLLIMAFMTLYYRLPGLLASIALVIYTAVVLAIFKIGLPGSGPVTLTLAGIAAFVLSVGMAVDANILIFERTKEELRNGRSLIPAVNAGFDRAWTSIRDSNVSTLITTGILYWMGNAFASTLIKGFALTLAIGVLISLFSAITVTRSFLRLATATPLARRLWLWTDDKPDVDERTVGALGPMEGADA